MSTTAHFSLAQYDAMIAGAVFGSRGWQRMEFIRGEVREMTSIGPRHKTVIETGEKAEPYAAAGVADYWVVDIAHQCLAVGSLG
jgi:hypothetical protein